MNENDYIITHYPIPLSLKSTSRLDVQAVQKDTKKEKITLVTGGTCICDCSVQKGKQLGKCFLLKTKRFYN